jgi:hypothetical protein
MQPAGEPSGRDAILEALRQAAIDTYGEERAAEATVQAALNASATALWRVGEEPLEPMQYEPLPTHG